MLSFLALLYVAASPTESIRPNVAVIPLCSQVVDSSSLEGIGAALASELHRIGKFRVMERSQISRILQEQGFQQSGECQGGECAVEMGKLLSVDYLVLGNLSKVGGTYSLSTRLVNVGSGEIARSATRNSDAKLDAILTEAVPAAAHDLSAVPWTSPSKRRIWPWVVGGTALAGGAAAVVLVVGNSSKGVAGPEASNNVQVKVQVP